MKTILRATTVPQSLGFFEGSTKDLIKSYDVQFLSSPGKELDDIGSKFGV